MYLGLPNVRGVPGGERERPLLVLGALAGCLVLAACGKSTSPRPGSAAPTKSQIAEATRLIDPLKTGKTTTAENQCVARVVVQNPNLDILANDMAQVTNKDLREAVMTSYLGCAYNFVLDTYMRFAPAGLSSAEAACIRTKFTELPVSRLAEVMVKDPDAEYTGPLVIQACTTGSTSNPLTTGSIPTMNGGS
jgi:hypothetical protein